MIFTVLMWVRQIWSNDHWNGSKMTFLISATKDIWCYESICKSNFIYLGVGREGQGLSRPEGEDPSHRKKGMCANPRDTIRNKKSMETKPGHDLRWSWNPMWGESDLEPWRPTQGSWSWFYRQLACFLQGVNNDENVLSKTSRLGCVSGRRLG